MINSSEKVGIICEAPDNHIGFLSLSPQKPQLHRYLFILQEVAAIRIRLKHASDCRKTTQPAQ